MPASAPLGIVDHDAADGSAPTAPLAKAARRERPKSAPAIMGIELATPATGWPPRGLAITLADLGMIDNGADQRPQHRTLRTASTEPRVLIVVCSLQATPDRGMSRFLAEAVAAISSPLVLALSGGHALRERGGVEQVGARVADWKSLGVQAGIAHERIVEIDLDHLTDASAARLAALVDGSTSRDTGSRVSVRRLETAFELIAQEAVKWFDDGKSVEWARQADLHRRIGQVYQHEQSRWRDFFRLPAGFKPDLAHIRPGMDRVLDLLPPRLRRSPRWLAAGAISGAMACVAAGTLVAPVALASLPMWSVLGAAIAALVQPAPRSAQPHEGSSHDSAADAVRAAALFATLLELQGRDELVITRVLDRTLPDATEPEFNSAAAAARWLDDLRHRFDMALASEARS